MTVDGQSADRRIRSRELPHDCDARLGKDVAPADRCRPLQFLLCLREVAPTFRSAALTYGVVSLRCTNPPLLHSEPRG